MRGITNLFKALVVFGLLLFSSQSAQACHGRKACWRCASNTGTGGHGNLGYLPANYTGYNYTYYYPSGYYCVTVCSGGNSSDLTNAEKKEISPTTETKSPNKSNAPAAPRVNNAPISQADLDRLEKAITASIAADYKSKINESEQRLTQLINEKFDALTRKGGAFDKSK